MTGTFRSWLDLDPGTTSDSTRDAYEGAVRRAHRRGWRSPEDAPSGDAQSRRALRLWLDYRSATGCQDETIPPRRRQWDQEVASADAAMELAGLSIGTRARYAQVIRRHLAGQSIREADQAALRWLHDR